MEKIIQKNAKNIYYVQMFMKCIFRKWQKSALSIFDDKRN